MRPIRIAFWLGPLLLAACGGGGGSDKSTTTVRIDRSHVEVTGYVDGTTPPAAVLELSANHVPSDGFFVYVENTNNGVAAVLLDDRGDTADVSIGWQNPSSLPLGTYEDTVTIRVCYDEACEENVSGSPIEVSTRYALGQSAVTTAGRALEIRALNLTASDLAWDPVSQRLYAAIPNERIVAVIDPKTATIERRQTLPGVVRKITTSDDGLYLYASTAPSLVTRLNLPDFTDNDSYLLASEFSVLDLDVAPGTHILAVPAKRDEGHDYVQIFSDAGFEALYGTHTGDPGSVTWNPDGVTLYAKGLEPTTDLHTDTVSLPADGGGFMDTIPNVFEHSGGDLSFARGRLVDDFGTVVDAEAGTRHGTLILSDDTISKTVADGGLQRIFAAGTHTPPRRIATYDLNSLTPIDTFEITKVPHGDFADDIPVTDLVRWGEDGIAISSDSRILLVSGTFIGQ